jgi:DNA-binding NarL/FixJ family response regulator
LGNTPDAANPGVEANGAAEELAVVKSRVLLIDDHPLLRLGLRRLFEIQPDLSVCGEADSAAAALEAIADLRPDAAVVDLALADRGGIDLLKDIAARWPKLRALVFSMHPESLYAERAIHAGALGYVMKRESPDVVLKAIRQILTGEIYLSDKMSAQMLRTMSGPRQSQSESPVDRLSDRELEIFTLIGKGFSTREIAGKIFISVKTVETHREHIKEKLKIPDRGAFLRFAVEWAANER